MGDRGNVMGSGQRRGRKREGGGEERKNVMVLGQRGGRSLKAEKRGKRMLWGRDTDVQPKRQQKRTGEW